VACEGLTAASELNSVFRAMALRGSRTRSRSVRPIAIIAAPMRKMVRNGTASARAPPKSGARAWNGERSVFIKPTYIGLFSGVENSSTMLRPEMMRALADIPESRKTKP